MPKQELIFQISCLGLHFKEEKENRILLPSNTTWLPDHRTSTSTKTAVVIYYGQVTKFVGKHIPDKHIHRAAYIEQV